MQTVALIPLRGGSKGILRKNIININGKPLCYWALLAATSTKNIDGVYVSTDSKEIAETVQSLDLGVKIVERPLELATDEASTDAVTLHFASVVDFDNVVTIQATSPLLKASQLKEAVDKYLDGNYDSLISTYRLKQFLWNEDATPQNYDPLYRPRRQDFVGTIVENGSFYITSRQLLMNTKTRIGGRVAFYDMPEETKFEIDKPSDLKICEVILKSYI